MRPCSATNKSGLEASGADSILLLARPRVNIIIAFGSTKRGLSINEVIVGGPRSDHTSHKSTRTVSSQVANANKICLDRPKLSQVPYTSSKPSPRASPAAANLIEEDAQFRSRQRTRHTATEFLLEKSLYCVLCVSTDVSQHQACEALAPPTHGPAGTKRPPTIPHLTHLGARTICRLSLCSRKAALTRLLSPS